MTGERSSRIRARAPDFRTYEDGSPSDTDVGQPAITLLDRHSTARKCVEHTLALCVAHQPTGRDRGRVRRAKRFAERGQVAFRALDSLVVLGGENAPHFLVRGDHVPSPIQILERTIRGEKLGSYLGVPDPRQFVFPKAEPSQCGADGKP